MLFRRVLLFALLLPMACNLYGDSYEQEQDCERGDGSWESGGCNGEMHCVQHNSGYGNAYPPSSYGAQSAERACSVDRDCGGGGVCRAGVCKPGPERCIGDDECPIGAACVGGQCGCQTDLACGEGLRCDLVRSSSDYELHATCVVCSDVDACAKPTCDPDGGCPGAMVCDERTVTCGIPTSPVSCTSDAACSSGMKCGSDGRCRRGPRSDAGSDARADAHADASDSSDATAD